MKWHKRGPSGAFWEVAHWEAEEPFSCSSSMPRCCITERRPTAPARFAWVMGTEEGWAPTFDEAEGDIRMAMRRLHDDLRSWAATPREILDVSEEDE